MTLNEALAVKARGLTKEQIIAHLRAVAENNLRADIRNLARVAGRATSRSLPRLSPLFARTGPVHAMWRPCVAP